MIKRKFIFGFIRPTLCSISNTKLLVDFPVFGFAGQRLIEFADCIIDQPIREVGKSQVVMNRGLLLGFIFREKLQRLSVLRNGLTV